MKTNLGTIKLALDFENTPLTVANFVRYVKEGFYNGTIFHRVIDGFMIQGGGLQPGMIKKPTHDPIINEAQLAKPNQRGSIAMARTNDPHSATAQFFINVKDNTFLNFTRDTPDQWGYCVFGTVLEGMDVVDKIKSVATHRFEGHSDVPVEDVVIEEVVLHEEEINPA